MKTFELITLESYDEILDETTTSTTLKVTEGEKVWWVSNQQSPRWQEYLRYTAWVEAGNTPEDFWTQDDELIEPSEPKEEETTEQPSSTDTKIETDLGE